MDGRKERWIVKLKDGLMIEWIDRQADRQIDRYINGSWMDLVV